MSRIQRVYIMESNGRFKIGISASPEKRVGQLRVGDPDIQLVYASKALGNASQVEHKIHRQLKQFHYGREWFSEIPVEDLKRIVSDAVEKYGIENADDGKNPFLEPQSIQFKDGKFLIFRNLYEALTGWVYAEIFTSCEARPLLEKAGIKLLPDDTKVDRPFAVRMPWPPKRK